MKRQNVTIYNDYDDKNIINKIIQFWNNDNIFPLIIHLQEKNTNIITITNFKNQMGKRKFSKNSSIVFSRFVRNFSNKNKNCNENISFSFKSFIIIIIIVMIADNFIILSLYNWIKLHIYILVRFCHKYIWKLSYYGYY